MFSCSPRRPAVVAGFPALALLFLAACAVNQPAPAADPGPGYPVPIAATIQTDEADYPAPQPNLETKDMRFLALGDSYTIGVSVSEADRWPVQLADLLRSNGLPFAPPQIIARNGWTTGELAEAIQTAGITPPYDLVSLLIGVNNQYRGYSQDEYRGEFAALLQTAIEFAGGKPGNVIVLSIPDWGATPFGKRDSRGPDQINAEIAAFNSINQEESERLGVRYVDIFPISLLAYEDASLIAEDGLHPSGTQYRLWAEAALPVVSDIFR